MFTAYISALATSEEFACYTLLGKRTLKNPKKSFKGDLPFLNKALTEVAESSGTMQELYSAKKIIYTKNTLSIIHHICLTFEAN